MRIHTKFLSFFLGVLISGSFALVPSRSAEAAPDVIDTATYNGHTYYLLSSDNWTNSEAVAVALGGHLATVNDAAENAWIYNTFTNNGTLDRALWIGLNDRFAEGFFSWVSNDLASYRNFPSGEPSGGTVENYVYIFPSADGRATYWNDAPDDPFYVGIIPVHGVVEVGPEPESPSSAVYNGHTYYLLPADTWTNSEAAAVALGGHLATVNDLAENTWIYNTFTNNGTINRGLWIGLNDAASEGMFVWSSQESVPYRNFANGEPSGGPENYVHIFFPADSRSTYWNDARDESTVVGIPIYGIAEVNFIASNTQPGNNVSVNLAGGTGVAGGVSITFAGVTTAGETTLATSGTGTPPPSGFKIGNPPVYYELSTTAGYTPPITICINYSGQNVGNESRLKLFHHENNAWVNATTSLNTDANIICATVSSLSPFAVFEENEAPVTEVITGLPLGPLQTGSTVNASLNFSDTNTLDLHTALWNWGDGSTSSGVVTETNGFGSGTGNHTYTTLGVYTVTATVADGDGGSGQSIYQFVVVYDPAGGFVTGGGWINSPLGAYVPNPTLTGKANFGFVSKYQKGKSIPDGNTTFHFNTANFRFKSTSYEWLVIAGPKAQYKGEGTVNNSGNYGFLLSARDGQINGGGGVDKFRIKIWDKNNGGTIVYDNQMGDADNGDATDVIEGGSIEIHSNSPKAVTGSSDEEIASVPAEYALEQNYPNPFNPETEIRFQLPQASHVVLKIFNTVGCEILTLADGQYQAGYHRLRWNGKEVHGNPLASGVYLYQLRAGGFSLVKKMSLLR